MLENPPLEGLNIRHAVFLAESLPRERQRQKRMPDENTAAGDEIERRMELE
jgi:hypothetical protein